MGRSIASVGDPKGCRGERREAGIQWIQPPKAVSDPEFRQTTSGAHGSAQLCRKQFPLAGPDAPTPARIGTGRPKGRSIASGGDPKGCRGRAESPLLASTRDNFAVSNSPWWGLTRRLRRENRACSPMGRSHFSFGGERKVCKRKPAARRLREKAGFFPPLPIAALPRRSWLWTGLPLAGWDASVWVGRFCCVNEWADSLIRSRRWAGIPLAG